MRLFSKSTEIELEDVRIGRVKVRVQENVLDRVIGWFDPVRLQQRLRARAALQGDIPSAAPRRSVVHEGYKPPPKAGWCHWSGFEDRRFRG